MTQQFDNPSGSAPVPDPDPVPVPDPDPVPEPLPQQEEFWRPPKRFGSIPVEAFPLGWDRRRSFFKLYPRVELPTQIIERVPLGNEEPHEPNRLIWGDNLHIMRQLPDNSIDLIYIDPPFFSGRQYNVMWGDNNERRSFDDIWEDGMPGYLIWLNARLYEMKRLLKPTGSIYVHCDWHASHYIKVEMDKIFGYENFRNEIVWHYNTGGASSKRFSRKHDTLLYYAIDDRNITFSPQREPYREDKTDHFTEVDSQGRKYRIRTISGKDYRYYLDDGRLCHDVWDLDSVNASAKERIGYPTQKPEVLLERIIKASSDDGDVVADFFIGGGTTAAVAQRLGRRFIVCDQSRVAVAVTAERLKQAAITRGLEDEPVPDFTVEQWGIYEAERLAAMPAAEFREFVLRAWGATRIGAVDDDPDVHGWRNRLPVWVGAPGLDSQVKAPDVLAFANAIRRTTEYRQDHLRDGVMLAWGFGPDALEVADRLREREHIDVNFVRLKQIRIGDAEFREHIVSRSTNRADYSEFLTFVQPPVVNVGYRTLGGRSVTFDAGDTAVVNPGAAIINVQWDFNYDGQRFTATPGYSLQRGKGKDKRPELRVTHKFNRAGAFRVACRVQDSRGGEGTWSGTVDVR